MIAMLAGWVRDRVFHPLAQNVHDEASLGHDARSVDGEGFEEAACALRNKAVTPQELGFRFQFDEFERLLNRIGNWNSVRFMKATGDPIFSIADVGRGRDGGVDAIIVISTRTERGANIVASRIRRIIQTQDY